MRGFSAFGAVMSKLFDPVILFFIVGLLAGFCKSNLSVPPAISRFLSMYLLMALGLKGGFALANTGFTWQIVLNLALALFLAISLPILAYRLLRRFTSQFDAAAIAATYGSVSAVTFITATQALESRAIDYGGHMAAAMALMEAPAILYAIIVANQIRRQQGSDNHHKLSHVLKESLCDGTQFLLVGSLLVGYLSGDQGLAAMKPFSVDLFKGLLAFFLLDMGLSAAKNWPYVRQQNPMLLAYALFAPMLHAGFALALAWLIQASLGNAILLMCLAASASYIAVPAALRESLPEANSSLYLGMSLGITFPLNIMLGIPAYIYLAQRLYN